MNVSEGQAFCLSVLGTEGKGFSVILLYGTLLKVVR